MNIFAAAVAGLACLLVSAPSAAASSQEPGVTTAPPTVEQVAIGAPGARMALAIWSPATTNGPLPLVVISHGTGAGPLAHVDTAEALASAGFVVAAPMHRGDNFQDQSSVGRADWIASRSRDVSSAIDYMVQEWAGRARLKGSKVGIFGFSAGATTALISAGGVPDLRRVASHCASQREFVCDILAASSVPVESQPPRWMHDSRIAAAVLAAPGLGFAFDAAGLDRVTIPVQLWTGAADQTVPYATNAGVVRRLLRGPVDEHEVANAVHLSFLAPCGAEAPAPLCKDNEGFDRTAFHQTFNQAVVDFFQKHLRAGGDGRR